jgi:hypothetical protein
MNPALGVSDFKHIIQFRSDTGERAKYFDKTMMIRDIINDATQFILFTRPRRFGKSLNMSMLKYFFGTKENLFSELEISKYPKLIESYQGNIPTIFLSLKDVKGADYVTMLARFSDALQESLRQCSRILDLSQLNWQTTECLSEVEITKSFKVLSEFLSNRYNTQVLILIDEYDTPLNTAYDKGYLDQAIDLIRSFFSQTFKDNSYLYKGILTGINRIAKESIFSELNNFKTHDIDSSKYATYYGFTESEIASLNLSGTQNSEIKKWYNGYNFGGVTIYNPWSILNYIDPASNFETKTYWSNSGGTDLIEKKFSMDRFDTVQKLLNNEDIKISIYSGIIYKDLDIDDEAFFNLLYNAGYLTAASDWIDNAYKYLKIANKEIHYCIERMVVRWITAKRGEMFLDRLVDSFITGQVASVQTGLQESIVQSMSFHDVNERSQESFYHGFLLGISLGAKGRYTIKSNRESGYGRYDIAWYPKDVSKHPGILIELKIDNSSAKKALAQINTKRYETDLVQYGCKKIISYGIHADGKNIKVAMKPNRTDLTIAKIEKLGEYIGVSP